MERKYLLHLVDGTNADLIIFDDNSTPELEIEKMGSVVHRLVTLGTVEHIEIVGYSLIND